MITTKRRNRPAELGQPARFATPPAAPVGRGRGTAGFLGWQGPRRGMQRQSFPGATRGRGPLDESPEEEIWAVTHQSRGTEPKTKILGPSLGPPPPAGSGSGRGCRGGAGLVLLGGAAAGAPGAALHTHTHTTGLHVTQGSGHGHAPAPCLNELQTPLGKEAPTGTRGHRSRLPGDGLAGGGQVWLFIKVGKGGGWSSCACAWSPYCPPATHPPTHNRSDCAQKNAGYCFNKYICT